MAITSPNPITELSAKGPLPKIGVTSVTPRITFARLVMPKTLSCSMFTEVSGITLDSLGVGLVLVRIAEASVLAEAGGVEQGQIHRRLPVQDPLRHHAARHWGMLEAVAAEADGEEETLHAGRGAQDGVVVGGEWT